jgi:hypothetical protein
MEMKLPEHHIKVDKSEDGSWYVFGIGRKTILHNIEHQEWIPLTGPFDLKEEAEQAMQDYLEIMR